MALNEVAVIGSGGSGLGAAFRLQQAGWQVRLIEAEDRVGGKMRTSVAPNPGGVGEWMVEEGPTNMSTAYRSILGIVEDAGLADMLIPAGTVFGFPRDGRIHYFDTTHAVRDALKIRFVSTKTKLRAARLMLDCLRRRRQLGSGALSALADDDTENGAAYAERLVGKEGLEYIVSPAVRALVGTTPDEVSRVDVSYTFANFLQGVSFVAFSGGMGAYAKAIASRFQVELAARVTSVKEAEDGVTVSWTGADQNQHVEEFAGCVLAVGANVAAELHTEMDTERRSFLDRVEYTPLVVLTAGLRNVPKDNPAMLIVIPETESEKLITIALEHNRVPGRTPQGRGMIGIYPTPEFSRELLAEDDEGCVKQLVAAADEILPGLIDDVIFTKVVRWEQVVIKAHQGYWKEMVRFEELSAQRDTRIQLAGDYFCTGNLNSATAAGERAAQRLIAGLHRP